MKRKYLFICLLILLATFTLSVRETKSQAGCRDSNEPNDDAGQATVITSTPIYATICPADEYDYYALEVSRGDIIYLRLSELPQDFDLDIWSDTLQRLTLRDNDQIGLHDEEINWIAQYDETLILIVSGDRILDNESTIPYRLDIGIETNPDLTRVPYWSNESICGWVHDSISSENTTYSITTCSENYEIPVDNIDQERDMWFFEASDIPGFYKIKYPIFSPDGLLLWFQNYEEIDGCESCYPALSTQFPSDELCGWIEIASGYDSLPFINYQPCGTDSPFAFQESYTSSPSLFDFIPPEQFPNNLLVLNPIFIMQEGDVLPSLEGFSHAEIINDCDVCYEVKAIKKDITTRNEVIAFVEDGDIWFFDPNTGERTQKTQGEAIRNPAWSPDGQYFIYSQGETEPDRLPDLYIYDLYNNSSNFLAENACCGAWSPDESRIIYSDYWGNYKIVNTSTMEEDFSIRMEAEPRYGTSWSVDDVLYFHVGKWIETGGIAGKVINKVIPYDLENNTILESPLSERVGCGVQVSHDGARLLFSACDELGELNNFYVLMRDESGEWIELSSGFCPTWSMDGEKIAFSRYLLSGNEITGVDTVIMNSHTFEVELTIPDVTCVDWIPLPDNNIEYYPESIPFLCNGFGRCNLDQYPNISQEDPYFNQLNECGEFIASVLGDYGGDKEEILKGFSLLLDLREINMKCGGDEGCIYVESFKEGIWIGVDTYLPAKSVIKFLANLIYEKEEAKNCFYLMETIAKLIIKMSQEAIELQTDAMAVHSPAVPIIIDYQGRMSGVLEDGTIINDIPGSEVIVLEDNKYILLPAHLINEVQILGTGDGLMSVDFIYNNNDSTQLLTYEEIPVNPDSVAKIDLLSETPEIHLDSFGDGNIQILVPTVVEVYPYSSKNKVFVTPGLIATNPITQSDGFTLFIKSNSGLLLLFGICALIVIFFLLVVFINHRKNKKHH